MRPTAISKRRERPSPKAAGRSALAVLLALALAGPVQLSYAADTPEDPAAIPAESAEGAEGASPEGSEAPQGAASAEASPAPEPSSDDEGSGDADAAVGPIVQPDAEAESANAAESASTLAAGDTEVRLAQSSIDAGVDPENFLPGVAGQTDIKLSVLYRPDPSQSGRWFTVKAPDGFSITTAPTSLESGTIEKSGDSKTLTVNLRDDVSVDVAFDIVVRQDQTTIYEMASAADLVLPFAIDSYTNAGGAAPVDSSSLDFKTAKFAAPEYTFTVDKAVKTWGDVSGNSLTYILTVEKAAYTALDADLKVSFPTRMTSSEGDVLEVSATGGASAGFDGTNNWQRPTAYGSGSISYDSFNYAFGDRQGRFEIRCESSPQKMIEMFSEQLYRTPELGAVSSLPDAVIVWSFDKTLALDTSVPGDFGRAFWFSGPSTRSALSGETGVGAEMSWVPGPKDPNIGIKDAEITVDFPVEVVLRAAAQDAANGGTWTYVTNKGNSINAEAVAGLDPADEWVVQARYRGPVVGGSSYGSVPVAPKFVVDVRSAYPDGTAMTDKRVYYSYKATSLTDPTPEATGTVPFDIRVAKDDLTLLGISSQAGIGLSAQQLGLIMFEGSGETKVYENLRIAIDDPAILGVLDELYFAPKLQGAVIEYSTNAGTAGTVSVSDAGPTVLLSNYVPEGEYLTSLSLSFEKLNGRNIASLTDRIYLRSRAIVPESLPSDPGTSLDGQSIMTSFSWSASGSKSGASQFTTTFYKPIDQQILSVADLSGTGYCPDDSPVGSLDNLIRIARIDFAKNSSSKPLFYQGMVVDLSDTDARVLSLVSRVTIGGGYLNQSHALQYTTNLDPAPRLIGGYRNTIDFDLQSGEYLTSLKFVPMDDSKQYDPRAAVSVEFFMNSKTWKFVNPADPFPDAPTSYPVKAAFSATNSASYDREGESVSFHNKASAKIRSFSAHSSVSSSTVYQGGTFSCSGTMSANARYAGRYKVKSPVYYFKVDKEFSYQPGTMLMRDNRTYTYEDVVVTTYALADGSSVLKVEVPDYSFDSQGYSSAPVPFYYSFDLRAKPMANPGSGKVPVAQIWADFNASTGAPDEGFVPVVLENTTTDATGDLGLPPETKLYRASVNDSMAILELVEVGASTLATADATLDADVEGHDDSDFGQQLSLVSHVDSATKDWIAYVPVPKAGLSAKYQEQEGESLAVKETAPSDYSQNLTGPVTGAGDDAVVTYCTDASPSFDLTGGAAGTYVDASAVSDWSAVTMIRISIPELAAREKRFPVVHYASDRKAETGDQVAYSGIYYNFKLGDAAEWYRGEGAYGAKNSLTLVDFLVNGFAWSQEAVATLAEPAAPAADRSPLAGVSISTANAVTGEVLSATTGADGRYSLAVPSHGGYVLAAQAPSSRYELVEMGAPGDPDSSKFDPATGEASVTLSKVDVAHVNAGYSSTGPITDPTVLPVTGGPGTLPLAAAGAVLMAGAALALRLRRNRLPRRR